MSGIGFFGNRPQTVADLFNQGGGVDFENMPLQGLGFDPISQMGVAAAAQSMRSPQPSEPLGNSIRRMLNDLYGTDPSYQRMKETEFPSQIATNAGTQAFAPIIDDFRARHAAGIASDANQEWLKSLTPENRRIYTSMQKY